MTDAGRCTRQHASARTAALGDPGGGPGWTQAIPSMMALRVGLGRMALPVRTGSGW